MDIIGCGKSGISNVLNLLIASSNSLDMNGPNAREAIVGVSVWLAPFLEISSLTCRPTGVSRTKRTNCSAPSTRWPEYSRTTSPTLTPAFAAGLSSSTLFTSTPRSSLSLSSLARSASISTTPTPRKLEDPKASILLAIRGGCGGRGGSGCAKAVTAESPPTSSNIVINDLDRFILVSLFLAPYVNRAARARQPQQWTTTVDVALGNLALTCSRFHSRKVGYNSSARFNLR